MRHCLAGGLQVPCHPLMCMPPPRSSRVTEKCLEGPKGLHKAGGSRTWPDRASAAFMSEDLSRFFQFCQLRDCRIS
uniref:Uncharacterized protein n=1 Tax=Tetraselmis sp. GSL018 TaxID=582737 RepID=A0A061QMD9_9CHLO